LQAACPWVLARGVAELDGSGAAGGPSWALVTAACFD
jgi:hypothetical protein